MTRLVWLSTIFSISFGVSSIKSANSSPHQIKNNDKIEDDLFSPIRVMCEVNGYTVPAIIDTGAQISIMSSSCAKRCHLFNRIDSHFSGKAFGVGSGDIIGRIDNMMMRVGPLSFKSRISVLRDSHVDFLIGLDFLKRFEGEVSLKDNVLRLRAKDKFIRIPFFSENNSDQYRSETYSFEDNQESDYHDIHDNYQSDIQPIQNVPSKISDNRNSKNVYCINSPISNEGNEDYSQYDSDDDYYMDNESSSDNVSMEGV
jgi:hypothetical protein